MIGRTIAHYRVLEKLGEGGMGVLYRAHDLHLDRSVALKVLRPEATGDPERVRRFTFEARAASALNHSNIVTIHDIDSADGIHFIAMECVEGQSLDRLIPERGLPAKTALHYGAQIAAALAAAHAKGIVHRDLKPANIMVRPEGAVKVLDFGLAKLTERAADAAPTETVEALTREGVVVGTVAYMSPEQAEGRPVDARSDVFSFGTVLYEMLSGRRPFQGDSQLSVLMAIVREQPAPVRGAPPELERILHRCFEKNPQARYASGADLQKDLSEARAHLEEPVPRRPRVLVPVLVLLAAVLAAASWFGWRAWRERELRARVLPELARLVEQEDFAAAFLLAHTVEERLRGDPGFDGLHDVLTGIASLRSDPPGAEIFWKKYMTPEAPWQKLGTAPLENVEVPRGYLRWRAAKPGFEPVERAFTAGAHTARTGLSAGFKLHKAGEAPPGMVYVPAGSAQPMATVAEFWLDKYEVTNQHYQRFVDAGGYQRREYWKQPFLEDSRTLSWEDAISRFRDSTGRPGPATWEIGAYPRGRAEYPVAGVSWYEAAAYAEFAGKSLPTIHHWARAARSAEDTEVPLLSNFGGEGPARAGAHAGLSPYGAYDLAGNVKEWCWNASAGKRYLLGGAWNEPAYMFTTDSDAQSPFSRASTYGFRCVKYPRPPAEALTAPVETLGRDFSKEKPAGEEAFRVLRSIYDYQPAELDARIESAREEEFWRREKATFNAAYGNERVIAYLYLPRGVAPPYQVVVYFPGSMALGQRSFEYARTEPFDFLLRSGRAVLYPIYKGTYERRLSSPPGPQTYRESILCWPKDLGRALDYLATRGDIDHRKIAYQGLSMGTTFGPILVALEPRIRTAIFQAGGFLRQRLPPELDSFHFAPHVKVPVLMLCGRNDFAHPVEAAQQPMFRLLGTPEKDKRHVLFDSGHVPPRVGMIREILDWLDRYLGRVRR